MTNQPPRLAVALLNRLADRNEALAGDLLEGYQLRRSRAWLWTQLIGAILNGSFRPTGEIRPLRLVDAPTWQAPRENFDVLRARLNRRLGGSPALGIGSLGIVALMVLMSLVAPALWMLVLLGVLSGVAAGLIRVAIRKRRSAYSPGGFTSLLPGRGGHW
jgi:hypothetical protein